MGKRRYCSLRAISPFTTVFSMIVQQTRKDKGFSGKGMDETWAGIGGT